MVMTHDHPAAHDAEDADAFDPQGGIAFNAVQADEVGIDHQTVAVADEDAVAVAHRAGRQGDLNRVVLDERHACRFEGDARIQTEVNSLDGVDHDISSHPNV